MTSPLLTMPDPYDGSLPGAERMTQHPPSEICRWVAAHKVSDCGYPKHSGIPVHAPLGTSALALQQVPHVLAQPEDAAPWEGQP